MRIVVCVKYVPDTALKVKIAPEGKSLDLADVSFVVNPYDEFAVEEALQLKERMGAEVIVVSAGAERATSGVRTCLAMGADSGVFIRDDSLENADPFLIGSALARVCQGLKPDLIFFGKHAIGVDNSQVPAVVAELLDLPQVSVVVKLEIKDGQFRAEREIEGAHEVLEGSLPAVFTAQKGLNMPRYASLKGIMAAKKKEIRVVSLDSLALSPDDLQSRIETVQVTLPAPRPPGKILTGDVSQTVPELVRLLHDEAKVI
jgi:electron transfer flavoprotein beta subunit